ncbi:MAG TPA: AI-2E family transporter [Rhodothermales bacterium]
MNTPAPIPAPDAPPQRRHPRVTVERALRVAFVLLVVAGIAWLLWFFASLVIYLLVGMILAYLLAPIVDRIQGVGLGRVPAILVTFVLVLGGLSVLATYLIPFIARQASGLSELLSAEILVQVAETVERLTRRLIRAEAITDAATRAAAALFQGDGMVRTFDSLVDLFTDIFYAVLVIPLVTFFFLKDGNRIRHNLLWFVPNRHFEITIALVEKIELNVGRYFRALLLQCVSVASTATVLLLIVGLDYAIAVGVFTGLANMIPYLGPLMGFLAGTLVAVAQTGDGSLIVGVLISMALTQITDNVIFQPMIFSRAARTHPLIILFVVLIAARVAGIVGMLLAIPLTATARVAIAQILWSIRNYRALKTS